jgi:alkanesulfonate monooxygenase SsuD/methylene tetrahydromethanopterin reductase-like flavin-dependent oxidoreductase (luciferase family)
VDRETEARRIARAAKQARPHTPRWLVTLSIVVGVTCCLALAIAWYGNRDVVAEHGARAPTSTNTGFAAGLLAGIAIGVVATAAVVARKR